ncbi:MAG TPA: MAPEG family protein [Kofleriaceae bacterium]|nr:MAPEG family protein [Kofleriaceae bacterium]
MQYVPYIAIAVAYALIYLPRQFVSYEMKKLVGGYDNKDPRGQQAQLEGRGKRALAAHQNSIEAFAPFAAGILVAIQRTVQLEVIAALAIAFVVARLGYIFAYIGDKASLRSNLWGVGVAATGALMILAIVG